MTITIFSDVGHLQSQYGFINKSLRIIKLIKLPYNLNIFAVSTVNNLNPLLNKCIQSFQHGI